MIRTVHVCLTGLPLAFVLFSCSLSAANPPITAMAFDPTGQTLVSGSQNAISVRQWPSLIEAEGHPVEMDRILDLDFSPDGHHLLLVGGLPGVTGIWTVLSWPELSLVASGKGHEDVIHSSAWLSDERFVTGGADNHVLDWQLSNDASDEVGAKIVRRLVGHSRRVLSVATFDAGRRLVSAGIDQSLRVWTNDVGVAAPLRVLDNHTDSVRHLTARPGDHPTAYVASASADRSVRIWQPAIGRLVRFARLPTEPLCIAWTADGNYIGAGCIDGKIRIINADTVEVEQTLPALNGWIYSVVASEDDSFAVAGSNGEVVRVQPAFVH